MPGARSRKTSRPESCPFRIDLPLLVGIGSYATTACGKCQATATTFDRGTKEGENE